jgi:hypothetical protein
MYVPADLLERIRLLLVRKRGPKRNHARVQAQLASGQGSSQERPISYRAASA